MNEIEEDGASELLSGLTSNLLAASLTTSRQVERKGKDGAPSSEPATVDGLSRLDLRGNRISERSHTFSALKVLGRVNLAFQRSAYGI